MKNKFRIKLNNDRIVGPFNEAQIGELYSKGHIDGSEKCQAYPIGDWDDFKNFEDLKEVILNIINEDEMTSTIDQSTKINTLARLGLTSKAKGENGDNKNTESNVQFNEFQFEKKQKQSNIDY